MPSTCEQLENWTKIFEATVFWPWKTCSTGVCSLNGWKQISRTKASAFCLMSLSRPCTGRGKPRKAWQSLYRSHWDQMWGRLWQLRFVRHDTRDVGATQGRSRTLQGGSLRRLRCAEMGLHRVKCRKARLNAIIAEL